jgi:hypothetical protein
MMFMVKAAQMGFATAKPYGDSRRYDFILDVGRRLWRVQVKSSSAKQYGSYLVNLQRNANGETVFYDASEIDFVVAYVFPCEAWFVIPVEAIAGRKTAKVCLHGNARSGKLGKYWEAWGLMSSRFVSASEDWEASPRSRKGGETLRQAQGRLLRPRSGQALGHPAFTLIEGHPLMTCRTGLCVR